MHAVPGSVSETATIGETPAFVAEITQGLVRENGVRGASRILGVERPALVLLATPGAKISIRTLSTVLERLNRLDPVSP